ncbi:hypothetical protein, partial [Mycobacteroides abscessus]|uniref:hypothetical protein n=1 Tax=Mycobacteroides abscessus TaxID=36809 RepID=UPI001A95930D
PVGGLGTDRINWNGGRLKQADPQVLTIPPHGTPHHYLSITMSPTRSRVLVNNACTDSLDSVAFAHDVRRT